MKKVNPFEVLNASFLKKHEGYSILVSKSDDGFILCADEEQGQWAKIIGAEFMLVSTNTCIKVEINTDERVGTIYLDTDDENVEVTFKGTDGKKRYALTHQILPHLLEYFPLIEQNIRLEETIDYSKFNYPVKLIPTSDSDNGFWIKPYHVSMDYNDATLVMLLWVSLGCKTYWVEFTPDMDCFVE